MAPPPRGASLQHCHLHFPAPVPAATLLSSAPTTIPTAPRPRPQRTRCALKSHHAALILSVYLQAAAAAIRSMLGETDRARAAQSSNGLVWRPVASRQQGECTVSDAMHMSSSPHSGIHANAPLPRIPAPMFSMPGIHTSSHKATLHALHKAPLCHAARHKACCHCHAGACCMQAKLHRVGPAIALGACVAASSPTWPWPHSESITTTSMGAAGRARSCCTARGGGLCSCQA
jgi:hypothetical protein